MTQYFTHQSFEQWPFLERLRAQSLSRCNQLSAAIADLELVEQHVLTVFAVGSAGRLELSAKSDLDGVVVLKHPISESITDALMAAIESQYHAQGFEVAKSSGIYRQPVLREQLLDESRRGCLDETPSVYGKRIQTLLDARPLFAQQQFAQLQAQVLHWFCPHLLGSDSQYSYLLAELKRYFHAYSAWQNFKFDKSDDDGWLLRQGKLRVTRTVTIAATILLIGASTDKKHTFDFDSYLAATPAERVRGVFLLYGQQQLADRFLTRYEEAVELMHDSAIRAEWIKHSPTKFEEVYDNLPESYKSVQNAAQKLAAMITAFILDRRDDWATSFYQDCLF